MTKRRGPRFWLALALVFAALIVIAAFGVTNYYDSKVLAVYFELLHRQATEQQVISRLGPPLAVVTDSRDLKKWSQGWSPQPDMRIGSKVLIYSTNDFFCDCQVYMYVDREGRLSRVIVAYT